MENYYMPMGNVKPLNLLFVMTDINISSLVIRAIHEGSNVKVYSSKYKRNAFEGILPQKDWVSGWRRHVEWADVIIFDDVGWGKVADRLRRMGKPVVGGSVYTDMLEIDRLFGQRELRRAGVKTLEAVESSSIGRIIKHIKGNPARYVLKSCGGHDSDNTMIAESKDSRDLLMLIEHNRKTLEKSKGFFLQRHVEGVEAAVGAMFDGDDFVYPLNLNFEYKRLFDRGLGPLTWEMGTTLMHKDSSRIFSQTLLRMRDRLRAASYVGYIDLNCIVNRNGIHPLEFTSRFGFPTTHLIFEGDRRNIGKYLFDLARGEARSVKAPKGHTVGALICVPPFPYSDKSLSSKYKGALIQFLDKDMRGIHLVDAVIRNGRHVVDGSCPLVVCARGSSVKQACSRMYGKIRKIRIENMYYRSDIGEPWPRESRLLRSWGYL